MDADASLQPLPAAITIILPSLASAFPLSSEDRAIAIIIIIIIMLFNQDGFLDVEMVKKVFYPEITRRGAFWGNGIFLISLCLCCHMFGSICILFLLLFLAVDFYNHIISMHTDLE